MINVSPRVEPERGGGFLVADGQEQQLRLYSPDGRLRGTFGRRGMGPGEFQHISRAIRLNDRRILVSDMGGTVATFDSTGTHLLHTARTGLVPLYRIAVIDDTLVAMSGRHGSGDTPLIHVWNLASDRVIRRFFPAPQGPPGFAGAYAFSGFTAVRTRGDTLAVMFALTDTIFLFRPDGSPAGRVPIRFRGFRRMSQPVPQGSDEEFQAWRRTYSAASDLFWLRDGSFLVEYFDRDASEMHYGLLHMARDGRGIWEVPDAPYLLAVTSEDSLVFVTRGSDAPNQWSLANLLR